MLAKTKDGEIIHIKDALIKTDYFCGKCGGRLRVRNGKIKVKHFYHLNSDCGDRGESLIHLYWKNYFSNLKEFDGYKITNSGKEVSLLKGNYISDIFLKTDKGTYLIIEICYKNPKTDDYKKFFKILGDKGIEKIYEIKVDFDGILNTKILFDIKRAKWIEKKHEELKKEAELIREYIIKTYYADGGLIFEEYDHMPYCEFVLSKNLVPKYRYAYNKYARTWYKYNLSNSLKYKKFKVALLRELEIGGETIYEESSPFYIKIYDYKNLEGHLIWAYGLGELINSRKIMEKVLKNYVGKLNVIFLDNI